MPLESAVEQALTAVDADSPVVVDPMPDGFELPPSDGVNSNGETEIVVTSLSSKVKIAGSSGFELTGEDNAVLLAWSEHFCFKDVRIAMSSRADRIVSI